MKEHKIDSLFKAKAGEGKFAYDPAYWTQAEKLLDASPKAGGISNGMISVIAVVIIGAAALLSFISTSLVATENSIDNTNQNTITFQNSVTETNSTNKRAKAIAVENTATFKNNTTDGESDEKNNALTRQDGSTENNELTSITSNQTTIVNENVTTGQGKTANKAIDKTKNPVAGKDATTTKTRNAKTNRGTSESNNNIAAEDMSVGENELTYDATSKSSVAAQSAMSTTTSEAKITPTQNENAQIVAAGLISASDVASSETTSPNHSETTSSKRQKVANQSNKTNAAGREKIVVPEIIQQESPLENSQDLAQTTQHFEDESFEIVERVDPLPKAFTPLDNFSFALGADYTYLFASRSLTGENADYINFRNDFENAQHINSIGINAQVGYGNWLFNTGIYQTTFKEDIQYSSTLMVNVGVDNGGWNPYDNWTYSTDSNWVVDSIYVGHWQQDTTWNVVNDSIYIAQWDTVSTEKEDPEIAKNNGAHTLTYIEVPLWFGRSFGAKRFTIDVQGGFAVGFLTATNGARYINSGVDGLVPDQNQKDQFQKVIFSAMLRTGVRFEIAPQWQVGVYPTLRYNLNSVVKLNGVKQKYLGYGINIGLSYRFWRSL